LSTTQIHDPVPKGAAPPHEHRFVQEQDDPPTDDEADSCRGDVFKQWSKDAKDQHREDDEDDRIKGQGVEAARKVGVEPRWFIVLLLLNVRADVLAHGITSRRSAVAALTPTLAPPATNVCADAAAKS
jgi:hypothetical protein